jgi:hypothetical protein
MIDCVHYRRVLLEDPHARGSALAAHLAACRECRAYTARLLRFEGRLVQALHIDAHRARRLPRVRGGWFALAASVLLALLIGTLWLGAPPASLAADVVAHMAKEPQAWARTDLPAPAPKLDAVLAEAHLRLDPRSGMVSYAQSCPFRGHQVPHLAVQTDLGPVTVMILVHESVAKAQPFDEGGYRGIILPVPGHGSLAVLVKDGEADLPGVQRIAARVKQAILWIG